MIKAMLVDDEVLTLRMLQKLIDWGKYDIGICSTALDGQEAYENFRKFSPELIITDIRMPKMDGIELIKKVKEQDAGVFIILISAHADFQYVQEAMKSGCDDYILKPIDEKELEDTLQKIVRKIHERNDINVLRERNELEQKKAALREYVKHGHGLQKLKKLFVSQPFGRCRLMSIHFGSETMQQYESLPDILYNQQSYITNALAGIIDGFAANMIFDCEEETWLVLAFDISGHEIHECSKKIIEFIRDDFQYQAKVCLSDEGQSMQELPAMYGKLILYSRYSMYTNEGDIFGAGASAMGDGFDEQGMRLLQNSINAAIECREIHTALSIIEQVLDISRQISPLSLHRIHEFCFGVVLQIKRQPLAGVAEGQAALLEISYSELSALTPVGRLHEFMKEAIGMIHADKNEKRPPGTGRYVGEAIRLLNENYEKNISLDEMCRKIAISKNYFCYLFKKTTGESVWSYLTKIRMEKAKEMLLGTDLKSFEVAYLVGYESPSYFSKTFKKFYSATPNKFRSIQASKSP